jgi:hypothetical protein
MPVKVLSLVTYGPKKLNGKQQISVPGDPIDTLIIPLAYANGSSLEIFSPS